MKKHILFVIAVIFAIVGCKIDEAGIPKLQTNALLTGKWFLKSFESKDPSTGITDIYNAYTEKDFYNFNSDNTMQYSSSSPDTAFTTRYGYSEISSVEKVTIGSGSDVGTYTINKLTADSLIMSMTFTVDASISGSVSGGGTTTTSSSSASASVPVTYKFAHK